MNVIKNLILNEIQPIQMKKKTHVIPEALYVFRYDQIMSVINS